MIKAYSYIRFSTAEQRKGDSMRRQLQNAQDFAEEHNLVLDNSLRDEGVSAFRGKNRSEGSLGAFLKKIEQGLVTAGSYLIIEDLDRLSREEVHVALRLFLNILSYHINIATLRDKKIYSQTSLNSNELLISISLMMRSHDESVAKSFRVGKAWKEKREKANSSKLAMTKVCPGWLTKAGKTYSLIEERAEIVRRIFRWSIEGLGTRAIARILNETKVPTWSRNSKRETMPIWHDSYIKKILDNPAVYGEFTPLSKRAGGSDATAEEPIHDYFPSVIERQVFFEARAVISARLTSNVRAPAGKHRNILTGLLKCANCNGGMHYIDKGKKGGKPYLRCGSSLLKGGCDHDQKYNYQSVQAQAILAIGSRLYVGGEDHGTARQSVAMEIVEVEGQIEKLVDALVSSAASPALNRRLTSLEAKLEDLKLKRTAVEVQAQNVSFGIRYKKGRREVGELVQQLEAFPDDVDLRVRATRMVRGLIKGITLSPRRFTCSWVVGTGFSSNHLKESNISAEVAHALGNDISADQAPTVTRSAYKPFFTDEDFRQVDREIEEAIRDAGEQE